MINVIAHHVSNDFDVPYRTEDVKFSPSGRRLAVAATDGCIILYAVDAAVRPVQLRAEVELRSAALLVPHGVDFLSEDVLVVANRNGKLAFFRVPPPDRWHGPCELVPLLEVQSRLFGTTGTMRKLRDRDLYCGPGSVRLLNGILYVSCNYQNTVSTFACQLDGDVVKVQEGGVVAHEGLEVVDGIALSDDGRLMALSDHDHHRVAVYRRIDPPPGAGPAFELACSLTDVDMHYAHGLRFDRDATRLYIADAGGQFIHIFTSANGWKDDVTASAIKTRGVNEDIFAKSQAVVPPQFRMLEGGTKGLDIAPDGKVIVVTCRNQVLRFLDIDGTAAPGSTGPAASLAPGGRADLGIALSCLVDDTPGIWNSIVPWLATALGLARIMPSNLHIHHVCALRPEIAQLCGRLGVRTHAVNSFDPRNLYANKIMQGSTQYGQVKSVVLTDVDIVFTDTPPFSQLHGVVAGKAVDMPNPPLEVLQEVFAAANIPFVGICTSLYVEDGKAVAFETLLGNFNGGMYVIPFNVIAPLAGRWAHWTRWLIDRGSLLGQWEKHADQVGFCLAVNELRLPMRLLDHRWNYPAHIGQSAPHAPPWILHHHARIDQDGALLPIDGPGLQECVETVNGAIRAFRKLQRL